MLILVVRTSLFIAPVGCQRAHALSCPRAAFHEILAPDADPTLVGLNKDYGLTDRLLLDTYVLSS